MLTQFTSVQRGTGLEACVVFWQSLVAFYLWLEILGETEFKVITD